MENTLENKEKFFSMYWGQKVVAFIESLNTLGVKQVRYEPRSVINFSDLEKSCLVLKLLSEISDEDAIECIRIFGDYQAVHYQSIVKKDYFEGDVFKQIFYEDKHKDGGIDGTDNLVIVANFSKNGINVLKSNREKEYWKVLDYLRSKSYLLPFHSLSSDQIIEYGWAKTI